MSGKLSGLQLDVLKLYRNLMRVSLKKDKANQSSVASVVREQFRSKASGISKSDFNGIEYNMRQGYKQLKLISMPGFTGAATVPARH